jgi:hypothetical protein
MHFRFGKPARRFGGLIHDKKNRQRNDRAADFLFDEMLC